MTFELTPKTMILIALAVVAVLGLVVLLPVFAIQAIWNAGSSYSGLAPQINVWQAALLYSATVLLIYLSGLVKIEVRCER
jgi:hypothetical protein